MKATYSCYGSKVGDAHYCLQCIVKTSLRGSFGVIWRHLFAHRFKFDLARVSCIVHKLVSYFVSITKLEKPTLREVPIPLPMLGQPALLKF